MNPKFRFLHWLPFIGLFTMPLFEFKTMEIGMPYIILNGAVQGFYITLGMISLIYFTSI